MFNGSPAFSGFSTNDLVAAREFYGTVIDIAWFSDPAGNILSGLSN